MEKRFDVIRKINSVSFELSSICNYAYLHKKCPVSQIDRKILSSKIVNQVLDELSAYEYAGIFWFNVYNEPMIDPRLFLLSKLAKEKCPDCKIGFTTNGFYLDPVLADELKEYGIDGINVSIYSNSEKERLQGMKTSIPIHYRDYTNNLQDNRLQLYTNAPSKRIPVCNTAQPLGDVIITCEGNIALCCLDWKRKYIFGDLTKQSFIDIVTSDKFVQASNDSWLGNVNREMCKNCSGWGYIEIPEE